jgi:hypothetical protein
MLKLIDLYFCPIRSTWANLGSTYVHLPSFVNTGRRAWELSSTLDPSAWPWPLPTKMKPWFHHGFEVVNMVLPWLPWYHGKTVWAIWPLVSNPKVNFHALTKFRRVQGPGRYSNLTFDASDVDLCRNNPPLQANPGSTNCMTSFVEIGPWTCRDHCLCRQRGSRQARKCGQKKRKGRATLRLNSGD